jgi:hypothetical protein
VDWEGGQNDDGHDDEGDVADVDVEVAENPDVEDTDVVENADEAVDAFEGLLSCD